MKVGPKFLGTQLSYGVSIVNILKKIDNFYDVMPSHFHKHYDTRYQHHI